MINKEMITVRMNRADVNTPWGFQVRPPSTIYKIEGGSLADRAGIQHGDEISKIQNENVNDFNRLQNIITQPIHEIELIIYRNMSSTRIWKPIISETSESENVFKTGTNLQSNVKVNLEHRPLDCDPLVNGFNTTAKPFNQTLQNAYDHVGDQKHFEISASHSTKAEEYLKEKGGLFGTDPNAKNAFNQKQNQPSYLNSETLKLIQEDDKRERHDKVPVKVNSPYRQESCGPRGIMTTNNINHNLPVCFICGRNILGLVCRAFDVNVHADCFSCSTCGSNLKNQGHHFVNSKFYCDVHGRQIKSLSQPHYSPNTLKISHQYENKPVNIHSSGNNIYQHDLSKPSFQTDIMARQPILNEKQNDEIIKNYSSSSYATMTNELKKTPTPFYGSSHDYDYYQQQPKYTGVNYQGIEENNKSTYTTQKNITFNGNNGRNSQQPYESRIPICNQCRNEIHGAFVMTGGNTYCPEHFVCANTSCSRKLVDIGFVEERGQRFCELCFEKLIAPVCGKCNKPITGDCLNALQKQFHPQCFTCAHCMKAFGNAAFYMENGKPYCERDWNNLFTTKCVSCKFPIEAGDRWVEALGASFHSNCFSCVVCHVNLEGQSFYAKNNQPYCRMHA